jgi:hypothetical protein
VAQVEVIPNSNEVYKCAKLDRKPTKKATQADFIVQKSPKKAFNDYLSAGKH